MNTKTMRVRSGVPATTDGRYLEAKEQLAGYFVVDCDSPERAVEIAARFPRRRGSAPDHGYVRPGDVTTSGDIEDLLRRLAPQVLAALVRHYGHFENAEDAVQEALLTAATQWPDRGLPDSHANWLITVASRGEVTGPLALMLLTDARRPARTRSDGRLVPLTEQERSRWNRESIDEGIALITRPWLALRSARTRSRRPSPPCTPKRHAPKTPTGRRSSRCTGCS